MKRYILILIAVAFFHVAVGNVMAAPHKVQVTEFTVTGSENAQEMKHLLKNLLSSRIAAGGILVVDDADGVIARITGGYSSFGTVFSIDASVKNARGELLGQRYVQGESQNELIPAIGRLADQLRALLPVPLPSAVAPVPVAVPTPAEDIVRIAPSSQPVTQQTRIEGTLIGIAPGRKLPGNEREFVVADATRVYLYRQTETLKKVAEYALATEGKILSVDTADVDNDGVLEVYVTVMDREELVSVALAVTESGFTPIAVKLPYFFRAVGLYGQNRKLFAQYAGRGTEDFYGDVCQVVKKGAVYSLGEPIKLPKHAHIFSFNMFADGEGKQRTAYIDGNGKLHIADGLGKELWKGGDRFGGSEMFFLRDEQQMQNVSLDRYRWSFIEQRIIITPEGEIIVPQNSGLLSIGNNRSFSKNTVKGFAWNGAALEEQWHTNESSSYLADYFYDVERKEVVSLEHTQKEGVFSKGASAIFTKKIK